MVQSVHGRGRRAIHLLAAAALAVTVGACTDDLADQVVKVTGERARWFGPGADDANIDSDVAWRAIGIVDRAAADWAETPDDVTELVTAFTDGWNAHLEEVGPEGLAGWCAGEPWVRPLAPVEVYTYARAISLQASSGAVAAYIPSAAPPGSSAADGSEAAVADTGDDGEVSEETRTTWATHYGPVIDFPGFGWTDEATITYRDGNIDNDEFLEQYLDMLTADDLDDFIEVHEQVNGVPLFNTIATSDDGRAWYADTSATPNLSDEALAAYEASLASDAIVSIAADNGAVLLDGSDPTFEWVEEDGARDPGLVPAADQPQVTQGDYVFNANDSFWVPHATALLEGDYSPLHGRQATPRSPRTRENAVVLDDMSAEGASGDDGLFSLDELADAALANRGFTARELLDDVVARCEAVGSTPVAIPAVEAAEPAAASPGAVPAPALPAAMVDVGPACAVLAGWDGVYDLDRAGPPLWREMFARYDDEALTEAGPLWATPFDPTQPISTPSGLATAPAGGPAADPVVQNLARAVQVLGVAGVPVDASLGDIQFALRDGERVPVHGGNGDDGTTNVVGFGRGWSILDPALTGLTRDLVAPGSSLARTDGETGYAINNGTSFLMALAFTDDGPEARTFLTYGDTEDRSDPEHVEATRRFSDKAWRDVPFTAEEVEEATVDVVTVRG